MKYFWLKVLFKRTDFYKSIKTMNRTEIEEHKHTAISKENYELAAYLEYYLVLKYKKETA